MGHAFAFPDSRATVVAHVHLLISDGYVEISVKERGTARGMGSAAACSGLVCASQVGQD